MRQFPVIEIQLGLRRRRGNDQSIQKEAGILAQEQGLSGRMEYKIGCRAGLGNDRFIQKDLSGRMQNKVECRTRLGNDRFIQKGSVKSAQIPLEQDLSGRMQNRVECRTRLGNDRFIQKGSVISAQIPLEQDLGGRMENKVECLTRLGNDRFIQKGSVVSAQIPFEQDLGGRMENKVECLTRLGNDRFIQKETVISAQIPQELVTEVLVRLPVKSLLRFRCLSESFRSFIDSPYFINLHMNTSAKNSNHLKLIFGDNDKLISTNYNSAKLQASDLADSLTDKLENSLYIRGYCNGVFLVLFHSSRLALWNPSTQKRMNIPSCPREIRDWRYGMGLGYDSTWDQYKVVLVVDSPQGFEVWIFGSMSNSWRWVHTSFFHENHTFRHVGKFAHGDLHWLCILDGKDFYSQDIVAFDVVKETFSLVTRPLYPTKERNLNLHVLDGCLYMSFLSYSVEEAFLYAGNKDGADFTWNMIYCVTKAQLPPFLDINCFMKVAILGYSKEGDKIMLNLGLRYLISYDPKEKSFQKTTIISRMSKVGFVEPCFESLVPLCDRETAMETDMES